MIRWFTAGESHGQGLMIIVEGIPAYLSLDEEYIAQHLARRQRGYGRGGRQQIERDHAHIQTGVRHGYTLGSPIGMLLENRDWVNWQEAMAVEYVENPSQEGRNQRVTRIRPGHADLPGAMKYGFHDVRNSLERASARETAGRVAAGAVAMRLLEEFGIKLHSHVISIGRVHANPPEHDAIDWDAVEESPVHCADNAAAEKMMAQVDAAREAGDTVGGTVEVIAENVPIGLGSHVHWDRKIDAKVAQALMSINAVKAVSIGPGWELMEAWGSEFQDVIEPVTDPDNPWQRKDQPRRRHRGRHDQRSAPGGSLRHQAHSHPPQSAPVGRSGYRRARPGPFRAQRRLSGPARRRNRRGHGRLGPGRCFHGKVRRR